MSPHRIELCPKDFQSSVRTSYTKETLLYWLWPLGSNQESHAFKVRDVTIYTRPQWCSEPDSNRQLVSYELTVLPIELSERNSADVIARREASMPFLTRCYICALKMVVVTGVEPEVSELSAQCINHYATRP